jgi:hypothetical protein
VTQQSEQAQKILDAAFAQFKNDYPEVARAIEAMNVSFADYVSMLATMHHGIETTSGNALTHV